MVYNRCCREVDGVSLVQVPAKSSQLLHEIPRDSGRLAENPVFPNERICIALGFVALQLWMLCSVSVGNLGSCFQDCHGSPLCLGTARF